mmetsp:Transcript_20294/g.81067  ORF Transcript_20294/g.81067 Transcript_20294/m.81067 type:complete len:639 (+) Transcript_20294:1309-3225(+)
MILERGRRVSHGGGVTTRFRRRRQIRHQGWCPAALDGAVRGGRRWQQRGLLGRGASIVPKTLPGRPSPRTHITRGVAQRPEIAAHFGEVGRPPRGEVPRCEARELGRLVERRRRRPDEAADPEHEARDEDDDRGEVRSEEIHKREGPAEQQHELRELDDGVRRPEGDAELRDERELPDVHEARAGLREEVLAERRRAAAARAERRGDAGRDDERRDRRRDGVVDEDVERSRPRGVPRGDRRDARRGRCAPDPRGRRGAPVRRRGGDFDVEDRPRRAVGDPVGEDGRAERALREGERDERADAEAPREDLLAEPLGDDVAVVVPDDVARQVQNRLVEDVDRDGLVGAAGEDEDDARPRRPRELEHRLGEHARAHGRLEHEQAARVEQQRHDERAELLERPRRPVREDPLARRVGHLVDEDDPRERRGDEPAREPAVRVVRRRRLWRRRTRDRRRRRSAARAVVEENALDAEHEDAVEEDGVEEPAVLERLEGRDVGRRPRELRPQQADEVDEELVEEDEDDHRLLADAELLDAAVLAVARAVGVPDREDEGREARRDARRREEPRDEARERAHVLHEPRHRAERRRLLRRRVVKHSERARRHGAGEHLGEVPVRHHNTRDHPRLDVVADALGLAERSGS